jgi:hypothetical protein
MFTNKPESPIHFMLLNFELDDSDSVMEYVHICMCTHEFACTLPWTMYKGYSWQHLSQKDFDCLLVHDPLQQEQRSHSALQNVDPTTKMCYLSKVSQY